MKINEILIRQVFEAVSPHRPSLNRISELARTDEGFDYRILGDLVIKSYPWPIGVELRRLFSGSMRQADRLRLDQVFKTLERIVQFLCFTMIIELWERAATKGISIPDTFRREFGKRIQLLSLGNMAWILKNAWIIGQDHKIDWFISEFGESFPAKFFDDIETWVPERNEIGHYLVNLSDSEIERRCIEGQDKLVQLLCELAFLVRYELMSVRLISVRSSRRQDARFIHTVDLLNSFDSDFSAKELTNKTFTESDAVLLTKDPENITEYLNLCPFIIDTHSEVIDTREKLAIRKDIFLYSSFKREHILYIGTEIKEKCDLRSLSIYPMLQSEFRAMLSDLGQNGNHNSET